MDPGKPPKPTGRRLAKKWGVDVRKAYYRETGDFYQRIYEFPGAYFDSQGYVVFNTAQEYEHCKQLKIGQRVHVRDGISSIPTYVKMQ